MFQRPRAAVDLKQLASLYRIAAKIPGLDVAGLQRIAGRMYQKWFIRLMRTSFHEFRGSSA